MERTSTLKLKLGVLRAFGVRVSVEYIQLCKNNWHILYEYKTMVSTRRRMVGAKEAGSGPSSTDITAMVET